MTTDHGSKACPLPFLDTIWAKKELQWGSGIWASAHNALRTELLDAVHQTLATDTYLSMIKLMYAKAFRAEDPLKIQRFSCLHHLLDNELLPAAVSQALASCKPVLTDMVNGLFNQHCHEAMPPGAFTELDGRMRGYFTQQIQAHLASLAKPGMVPSTFTLTEDDSTSAARATLLDKLKQLRAAMQTISQIAGVPVLGSNASMTHTQGRLSCLLRQTRACLRLEVDTSMLAVGTVSSGLTLRLRETQSQTRGLSLRLGKTQSHARSPVWGLPLRLRKTQSQGLGLCLPQPWQATTEASGWLMHLRKFKSGSPGRTPSKSRRICGRPDHVLTENCWNAQFHAKSFL